MSDRWTVEHNGKWFFLTKRAEEIERVLTNRVTLITVKPVLRRMCYVTWKEVGVLRRTGWGPWDNLSQYIEIERMRHRGSRRVDRVVRAWAVITENGQYTRLWNDLKFAQAERSALEYHYARYLMTRGTGAQ